MKTEFTLPATLSIIPETCLEMFALQKWYEEYLPGKTSVLQIEIDGKVLSILPRNHYIIEPGKAEKSMKEVVQEIVKLREESTVYVEMNPVIAVDVAKEEDVSVVTEINPEEKPLTLKEYRHEYWEKHKKLKSRDKVCKCGESFHDDSDKNNRLLCPKCVIIDRHKRNGKASKEVKKILDDPKIDEMKRKPANNRPPIVLKPGETICANRNCKKVFKAKIEKNGRREMYCSVKCEANA